jgi:hypothetical protein
MNASALGGRCDSCRGGTMAVRRRRQCACGPTVRPGIALPAAIITLGIIALFIAGSAYLASEEFRAGVGGFSERSALEAAEYAATAPLRDWDPTWNLSTVIGETLGAFADTMSDGAVAAARATRTGTTTFWVVGTGTSGAPNSPMVSRRIVSVLYRLALAAPEVGAALTVRDSAEVRPGGLVTGSDTVLAGPALVPACATPAPAVAGVSAPDTLRVCDGTCGARAGNIRGTPPVLQDRRAADSARYLIFGPRTWTALTGAADIVVPPNATIIPAPAVAAGACQRSRLDNWGDPDGVSVCGNYYPLIWARGNVTISGGAGQGILLADGDISLAGGARFTGLVVARDDIIMQSSGGTILGAALAGDATTGPNDHTVVGVGGLIRYSACGLESALLGAAWLQRVRQRAWAEMPQRQ